MKAVFFASAYTEDQIPQRKEPKILIAGRSNVGKSSLINHLFQNSSLAKVSKKPGKTVSLNFYLVENRFLLVDLPGYGFSKTSSKVKSSWGPLIDHFLNQQQNEIGLMLLLIDSRRDLSSDDLTFLEWVKAKEIPLLLIFTKCDKQKPDPALKKFVEKKLGSLFQGFVEYTIKQDTGRQALLRHFT